MKKNKLFQIAVLSSVTAGTIYAINRSINLLANARAELNCFEFKKYEWRFGDVYYTKRGNGKPLLLVHELSCGGSDLEWKQVVDEYAKTNTVYTIDLLGCGRSDKPAFTYTNFLYVQLISDFIKNIIGKRTDVICSGSSANFIIMACYNDDSLFDKIAIINPQSIAITSKNMATNKRLTKLLIEMPLIGTTIFNICNSKNTYKSELSKKMYSSHASNGLIKNFYDASHYGTMTSKYLFASISANYTNINISHALKSINNSIVIIGGETEPNILEIFDEYKELNSAIETSIIDKTKHFPQLEQPKSFVETLKIYMS